MVELELGTLVYYRPPHDAEKSGLPDCPIIGRVLVTGKFLKELGPWNPPVLVGWGEWAFLGKQGEIIPLSSEKVVSRKFYASGDEIALEIRFENDPPIRCSATKTLCFEHTAWLPRALLRPLKSCLDG